MNHCFAGQANGPDARLDSGGEPVTIIVIAPPVRTAQTRASFTFSGGESYVCRACTRCRSRAVAGGLTDPTPASASWEVDRTGPTVTLVGPEEGSSTGVDVKLPRLPPSLAQLVPTSGVNQLTGQIELIDSTAIRNYAEFREAYFKNREPEDAFGRPSRCADSRPPAVYHPNHVSRGSMSWWRLRESCEAA